MSNYVSDYTSYMRNLAKQHTSLQHSSSEAHFFRGELQEFFDNLRSRVNFPCLLVEGSEVEYAGVRPNIVKKRTTSFIVADTYNQVGDYGEMEQQMSSCEKIAEEILGRMISDKTKPFKQVDIDSVDGQYLANEAQRYVGYRINLTLDDGVCLTNNSVWDEED